MMDRQYSQGSHSKMKEVNYIEMQPSNSNSMILDEEANPHKHHKQVSMLS